MSRGLSRLGLKNRRVLTVCSPYITTQVNTKKEESKMSEEVCKECGKIAEATTEKVWQSYLIVRNEEGKVVDYKSNDELDEETIEVYHWCRECLSNSDSWD